MLGVSGASALAPILMAASPDREGFLGQEPAPRSPGRNHGLAPLCVPQTEEAPLARPAVLPGLRLNPCAQRALPPLCPTDHVHTPVCLCFPALWKDWFTPSPHSSTSPHPPPHTIRLAGGLSAAGLPPLGGEEGGKAAPVLGSALPCLCPWARCPSSRPSQPFVF